MIRPKPKRVLDPERITKPISIPLNTEGFALPKPPQSSPQQPKDGRLIESAYRYRITKREMWIKQNKRCANCPRFLPSPAFGHKHHPGGRGLGGGKRDDRMVRLICIPCHRAEHEGMKWSKVS